MPQPQRPAVRTGQLLHIRVTDALLQRIDAVCKAQDRPRSRVLREFIENGLARLETRAAS